MLSPNEFFWGIFLKKVWLESVFSLAYFIVEASTGYLIYTCLSLYFDIFTYHLKYYIDPKILCDTKKHTIDGNFHWQSIPIHM